MDDEDFCRTSHTGDSPGVGSRQRSWGQASGKLVPFARSAVGSAPWTAHPSTVVTHARGASYQSLPTDEIYHLVQNSGQQSPGVLQDRSEVAPCLVWPLCPTCGVQSSQTCTRGHRQRAGSGGTGHSLCPGAASAVTSKSLIDPSQLQAWSLSPASRWGLGCVGEGRGRGAPSAGSCGAEKWRRLRWLPSSGTPGWGQV